MHDMPTSNAYTSGQLVPPFLLLSYALIVETSSQKPVVFHDVLTSNISLYFHDCAGIIVENAYCKRF